MYQIVYFYKRGESMLSQLKIGEQIKAAREQKGMTQEQLAEAIGMTQRMVSSYERGKVAVSRKAAEKISRVLGLSVAFLLRTSNNPYEKIELDAIFKKTIPVFDSVSAGGGSVIAQEPIGTIQATEGDFAIKIKGDSMPPLSADSYVIVKKVYDVRDVTDGTIVVVRINGDEAVLKYWFIEDDYGVVLRSENIDYKPRFIPYERFYNGECELIGIAVGQYRNLKGTNYKK